MIKTRYRIDVEYDGTNYRGWQKNSSHVKSIQGVLEDIISKINGCDTRLFASGRTDAGVHAISQTCHFDLDFEIDPLKLMGRINAHLKDEDISIIRCSIETEEFHSRFSAKIRSYKYIIVNRYSPLKLQKQKAWHYPKHLDEVKMDEAAKFFIGRHDFSSFRDSECQSQTPVRTIFDLSVKREGDEIVVHVKAKSFLHHMVRNIVGTLTLVGSSKIKPSDIALIIEAKDRTKSGPNAPAYGLYFVDTKY